MRRQARRAFAADGDGTARAHKANPAENGLGVLGQGKIDDRLGGQTAVVDVAVAVVLRDLLQARVAAPHELAHGALDRGLSRAAHGFSDVDPGDVESGFPDQSFQVGAELARLPVEHRPLIGDDRSAYLTCAARLVHVFVGLHEHGDVVEERVGIVQRDGERLGA